MIHGSRQQEKKQITLQQACERISRICEHPPTPTPTNMV